MDKAPEADGAAAAAGPSAPTRSRSSSPPPAGGQTLRRPASHGRLTKLMIPGRSRSGSTVSNEAVPVTAYAEDRGRMSGRSTPEQRRRTGRAAVSLLASDAKYKKYTAQVERCLQSFESVNEWADFISFLSRLLKTLQSVSPPYAEIPKKLIVAKRLAQCLNPALPSGVHQRALDVYSYIFSIIGPEGLRRDLLIWSSGLFPFFQFAATSVRPLLLTIYETFYLALEDELRPATKAFILALLPGLEEEAGDFFDRVLSILTRVSAAVTPPFFLSNVFLALITTPSARLAALNYLSRRMAPPDEEQEPSVETGLLIRGLAAAVSDENMLVRRNALDLVVRHLKLDGAVFSNADEKDKALLVRRMASVVLQRELSLSRRVYAWFLGPGETPSDQATYFKAHGLGILSSVLNDDMLAIASTEEDTEPQRPFKIFLSLQDKYEIGGPLAELLALPALQAIKQDVETGADASRDELLTTASAVYEAIEPVIVWRTLHQLMNAELPGDSKALDDFVWIAKSLPQADQEMAQIHAPVLGACILDKAEGLKPDLDQSDTFDKLVDLAAAFIAVVPATTWSKEPFPAEPPNPEELATALYVNRAAPETLLPKIKESVGRHIVTAVFALSRTIRPGGNSGFLTLLQVIRNLVDSDAPALAHVKAQDWVSCLSLAIQICNSFTVASAVVETILLVARSQAFPSRVSMADGKIPRVLFEALFRYLDPQHPSDHARAVELIWEINRLAPPYLLEEVTARRMQGPTGRRPAFDSFGVLWSLTDDALLPGEIFYGPLCILVDALKSDDPCLQQMAETWMRCHLRSYFRVLDPLLSRLAREVQSQSPLQALNYSSILYLVESLGTLLRFGGKALSKACHTTEVASSPHPLISSVTGKTYLDYMIDELVQLLPPPLVAPQITSQPLLLRVHSAVLENLQLILAQGDVPQAALEALRQRLLSELDRAVRMNSLTLQSKMLHLLHSAMGPAPGQKGHQRYGSLSEKRLSLDKSRPQPQDDSFAVDLTETVVIAISTRRNRPVLQHWIDFLLMSSAFLGPRRASLLRLNAAVASEIRDAGAESTDKGKPDGEGETLMLLTGLDRVLFLLGQGSSSSKHDERSGQESSGMFAGLVSTFIVEGPTVEDASSDEQEYLDEAASALLALTSGSVLGNSKVDERVRKLFDKLFRATPKALIATLVRVWATNRADVEDDRIIETLDSLAPSAQRAVEMIIDVMDVKSGKGFTGTEPHLAFLEAYLGRLEAPIAVQVWTPLFAFAKDAANGFASSASKGHFYPILRCLTTLSRTVATTSALEDRRLRRELQEVYPRVLDIVCSNLGKIAEPGVWQRPVTIPEGEILQQEAGSSTGAVEDVVSQIQHYIAERVLPNLRSFLLDNDKVAASCSTVAMTNVVPAFKQQKVTPAALEVLGEMAKIPASVRAWRAPVSDAFNDNRFFRPTEQDPQAWKRLICALMDSEKERFGELQGRITAAPSANIFTNREQEMITRSYNLRRLSFVLLAAEENHYLAQLPSIQEKLVDILRTNVVSPRVHSEVYLCLRVLMCRISAQHLANFWPVILSELVGTNRFDAWICAESQLRVFEAVMDDVPADGSEQLQLVLAACKFLDLLLVMQSEDFQIHQWMFVTDTTDAIYPPEDYHPEGIMDRLSEILSEHSHVTNPLDASLVLEETPEAARRPRLSKVRTLTSLHQLREFFSRASIDIFEGVYAAAGVDWPAVEESLMSEIFEVDPSVISRVGTPRLQ